MIPLFLPVYPAACFFLPLVQAALVRFTHACIFLPVCELVCGRAINMIPQKIKHPRAATATAAAGWIDIKPTMRT